VIFCIYMARASTAIGVSPTIKETVQKQAHSTRLTLKEVILMGMLAVDRLDDSGRQELADQVHQMQVQGEI
jgi:anti-anti-sigma regulatory factor